MELMLKEIGPRLEQRTSKLEAQAASVEALEERISAQIVDLQHQIQGKMVPAASLDAPVILEEGCAVDLDELEKRMEEKCSLLTARERELQELQKKISEEFEKLRSEIRERDILPASREIDVRGLKQRLGARTEELKNFAKNQLGARRRTNRLVSFLVDIGKKH